MYYQQTLCFGKTDSMTILLVKLRLYFSWFNVFFFGLDFKLIPRNIKATFGYGKCVTIIFNYSKFKCS